jgi:hypothetical protein
MGNFDLLTAVQPEQGWYAVVGIKGESRQQEIVETREEFDEWVEHFQRTKRNVFFGVAKYKDGSSRKKDNVLAAKSFWLDIDCGPGKEYDSQAEALDALRDFCKTVGLPKPTLVNSGRGIHVYWPLEEDITREEWEPVAKRLKEVCGTQGLRVDNSCVEIARILRVPGTLNFKGDEPLPVVVIHAGKPVAYDTLREVLGVREQPAAAPRSGRALSPLAQMIQDSTENSFTRIMQRGEAGCPQLISSYQERGVLSEPRWFSALSIAKFCRDKDKAIHRISADHPDYDPDKVEQKLKHIVGPHTCEVFESNNPGGCAGCPHKGKIKSPIVLGKVVAEPEGEVDDKAEDEEEGTEEGEGGEKKPKKLTFLDVDGYKVPEYPFPFKRGPNGAVCRVPDTPEGEAIVVYPYALYIVKRMHDPNEGGVVLVRSHTPKDGVQEFTIPNTKISDPAEIRKELARRDVLLDRKSTELMVAYIIRSAQELRHRKKAEQMRNQFGWADGDSKFIIGNREISAQGTQHSPPSSVTQALTDYMHPTGSLEKWAEVFNLYGRPGLEGAAFAAATAFGAPLLKFSGQRGAIINLVNTHSGTGKTTALHMCNSVWGHPARLCAKKDDTFNSKVFKIGIMCNLPVTFDEMSNTEPKQLSELSYLVTQGEGKDRMRASSNELRVNLTSWQTIALCSSNHSFYEKLEFLKDSPQGEMMRIIEYSLDYSDAIDTETGKQMFDHQLHENYGHAGAIYARYIVEKYEEVKQLYLTIQNKIDTQLKLTQRERFWSATVAANITGIMIAMRLDLFDWDIAAIFKWACNMIRTLRKDTVPPIDIDNEVLGHFLLGRMDNILVVDDGVDLRSNMQKAPTLEPKREVIVRYEPDTEKVYISVTAFRHYCTSRNISYRETTKKLEQKRVLMPKRVKKRLTKGMKIDVPAVQCLVLDGKHSDFSALAKIVPEQEATENASGGG